MTFTALTQDIDTLSLQGLVACRGFIGPLRQRTRPTKVMGGARLSRRLGRGLDFAEVRAYQAGDDVRTIDWRVTARRGQAHTKLFLEEHESPTLALVDISSSMRFATRGAFKSVRACQFAAALAWRALQRGEHIGGIVSNGERHWFCAPSAGQRGVMRWLQTLVLAHQEPVSNRDTKSSLGLPSLLRAARQRKIHGSHLTLLSDHRGVDPELFNELRHLVPRNQLAAVQVIDAIEKALPPEGLYPVSSLEGEKKVTINTAHQKVRQQYQDQSTQWLNLWHQHYQQLHANWQMLSTDIPLPEAMQTLMEQS